MEISELYSVFRKCGTVATDSRRIRGGELFFALKGENFDGDQYAEAALSAGAAAAVVSEGYYLRCSGPLRGKMIPAEDTLTCLQTLARYHRENVVPGRHLTVIGITGTNGKTTTKELIRAVLSAKYNVTATEGNFNNSVGVPLSLLGISPDTELAIIEMGANHPDDIADLVKICEPDCGIVTNVGRAHLQGFGSFEGVKKAKGQLYDWLRSVSGPVFINADDADLTAMADSRGGLRLEKYGLEYEGCRILPVTPDAPYLRLGMPDGREVDTSLVGAYNAANVLAAICIGRHFGVDEADAAAAVADYVPSNSRSQMMRTRSNVLIIDAYNANPTSMSLALDSFAAISAKHKAALLGSMGELGESSLEEHIAVLKKAVGYGFDRLYLVGDEFAKALAASGVKCSEGSDIRWFENSDSLAAGLSDISGYTVLVKGSRSARMENVIPSL